LLQAFATRIPGIDGPYCASERDPTRPVPKSEDVDTKTGYEALCRESNARKENLVVRNIG
jgi:hypothetical protein